MVIDIKIGLICNVNEASIQKESEDDLLTSYGRRF